MTEEDRAQLNTLLARLRAGDPTALDEVFSLALKEVRRRGEAILRRSFPTLYRQHDLDSVVNQAWIRCQQRLGERPPADDREFFRVVTHRIRMVLLDMARHYRQEQQHFQAPPGDRSPAQPVDEQATISLNAEKLAQWREFHQAVEALPDLEREVFELHYYEEETFVASAALLGLPEHQVRRLWKSACARLEAKLP